ncbi:MAG: stage IV sporulation protein A [Lachnospiraceae bacterium]|nr:stage IV sporulation protein A [Lachnospiraceae bacterium]
METGTEFHLYKDIQQRTNGEIYIGVVGPVRTGKSTFIKYFMKELVLPEMTDVHSRELATDELPQSAAGKTVMTTEPKFIPKDAAQIEMSDGIQVAVRLIDCVGFMVDGAIGHMEEDAERMVKTPWFPQEIPFTQAAEIGTRKVIHDHSTIGLVITTDGSFTDIPAESYREAEEKTIQELKKLGKPYIVLLNTTHPYSVETLTMAAEKEQEYGVRVLPVNCEQLKKTDIDRILKEILEEFPISEIQFRIPKWTELLERKHEVKAELIRIAKELLVNFSKMKDFNRSKKQLYASEKAVFRLEELSMEDGTVKISVEVPDTCYYEHISEMIGTPVEGEHQLIRLMKELAEKKKEYEKVAHACDEVRENGYGIVMPSIGEVSVETPEIIRHGNKFGVKLKATAPSVHMIQADVVTEIAPIVGTKEQAEDLIEYMLSQSDESESGIWNTNIFGKTLQQLVEEGIQTKIDRMSMESRKKMQDTMKKIVNESNGGMICIII